MRGFSDGLLFLISNILVRQYSALDAAELFWELSMSNPKSKSLSLSDMKQLVVHLKRKLYQWFWSGKYGSHSAGLSDYEHQYRKIAELLTATPSYTDEQSYVTDGHSALGLYRSFLLETSAGDDKDRSVNRELLFPLQNMSIVITLFNQLYSRIDRLFHNGADASSLVSSSKLDFPTKDWLWDEVSHSISSPPYSWSGIASSAIHSQDSDIDPQEHNMLNAYGVAFVSGLTTDEALQNNIALPMKKYLKMILNLFPQV